MLKDTRKNDASKNLCFIVLFYWGGKEIWPLITDHPFPLLWDLKYLKNNKVYSLFKLLAGLVLYSGTRPSPPALANS